MPGREDAYILSSRRAGGDIDGQLSTWCILMLLSYTLKFVQDIQCTALFTYLNTVFGIYRSLYIYIYKYYYSFIHGVPTIWYTHIAFVQLIIFFSFSLACQRGWNVKEAARGLWGDLGSRPEGPARIPSFYGNEGNKTWQQLHCFLHQFPSKNNGKTGQNVKVCTSGVFGVDFLGYTHRKFNMDTKKDGSGKPEGHTFHVTVHSHHL